MTDPTRPGIPALPPDMAPFVGRVMAVVEEAPIPSAPRSFMAAARERSWRNALDAVRVATHVALRGRRIPTVIRVQASALVVAVLVGVGASAAFAGVAAYRFTAPILQSADGDVTQDVRDVPTPEPTIAATPDPSTTPPPQTSPSRAWRIDGSWPGTGPTPEEALDDRPDGRPSLDGDPEPEGDDDADDVADPDDDASDLDDADDAADPDDAEDAGDPEDAASDPDQ